MRLAAISLTSLIVGCVTEAAPTGGWALTFVPEDFQTDVLSIGPTRFERWEGVLGVYWEGGYLPPSHTAAFDAFFAEHLHLVSLATGRAVEGRVVPHVADVGGHIVSYSFDRGGGQSFVPDTLAEGWYVLVVDVGGWSVDGMPPPVIAPGWASVGDLHAARVYVGSHPTWWSSEVLCSDGTGPGGRVGCDVGVLWSEPVEDVGALAFELLVDGSAADCGPFSSETDGGGWHCGALADGSTFEIRLVETGNLFALSTSSVIVAGGVRAESAAVDPSFGLEAALAALP